MLNFIKETLFSEVVAPHHISPVMNVSITSYSWKYIVGQFFKF